MELEWTSGRHGRSQPLDVVDAANDNALLVPMVEQAEETTGTRVPMTLADAGYFAVSHLAECDRRGQQVVVSEARQRFLTDAYHKDRFTYDEQSDSFTCRDEGSSTVAVRVGVPGLPATGRLARAMTDRHVVPVWKGRTAAWASESSRNNRGHVGSCCVASPT